MLTADSIALNDNERYFKDLLYTQANGSYSIYYDETELGLFCGSPVTLNPRLRWSDLLNDNQDIGILRHIRYMPPVMHNHDFIEINCVLKGRGYYYDYSGRCRPIQSGDIIVIAPQAYHAIASCSDDFLMINILIKPEALQKYFSYLLEDQNEISEFLIGILHAHTLSDSLYFKCGDDIEIESNLNCIYQLGYLTETDEKYKVLLYIELLLFNVLKYKQKCFTILNSGEFEANGKIQVILQYLYSNYKQPSLGDAARVTGYSQRHIERLMRKHAGLTFSELARKIRLYKAVHMLETTQYSIQTLVDKLGYSDISHFYRVFKAEYDCTPVEYRKRKREIV